MAGASHNPITGEVCDVDFGHEFWTAPRCLVAGERRLSQNPRFCNSDPAATGRQIFLASTLAATSDFLVCGRCGKKFSPRPCQDRRRRYVRAPNWHLAGRVGAGQLKGRAGGVWAENAPQVP